MSAQRQRTLAGIAVAASMLIWLGAFILLFYIPRLAASWAELGGALSGPQRILVFLSRMATKHGLIAIPSLLAGTAAAIWWRMDAVRRLHAAARGRPL